MAGPRAFLPLATRVDWPVAFLRQSLGIFERVRWPGEGLSSRNAQRKCFAGDDPHTTAVNDYHGSGFKLRFATGIAKGAIAY